MSSTVKSSKITAHAQPCTQLLDVPVASLTNILQHVALQDRMGVCMRVCRAFHAAAVAATNSIRITSMSSQPKRHQLAEWLQRHGTGLTALQAQHRRGYGPSLASLPCPRLRDLSLQGFSLQPGCFNACTSLTRLIMEFCDMDISRSASSSAANNPLTQLSVLSNLQHLELCFVGPTCSATKSEDAFLDLPSSLLCHLVRLTYLQLGPGQVQSDAALRHLHALTALQHLGLDLDDRRKQQRLTAAVLTGLQHLQHLTALRLCDVPWAIDLRSMPAVTALTALRVLLLWDITSVHTAVLAGVGQLQDVRLRCKDAWDAEGAAALLAAIGRQPQLTRLELHPYGFWSTPSAAAYSALTASSHLRHLQLTCWQLSPSAWPQMFPPGRCLPELLYLCLEAEEIRGWRPQLSTADIQAMVSCCPALTDVEIGLQLAVSAAAPLAQLTGLTDLTLYASIQDNASSIARLTGLQNLILYSNKPGDRVTASGLLQLTALQQLHYFCIEQGPAFDPGLADYRRLDVRSKARVNAPPDVWLQLKERCEAAQQLQAG